MRVRWVGDGDRELADPQVVLRRLEWVDLPVKVARDLVKQDGFELEAAKKAARTRKKTTAPKLASGGPRPRSLPMIGDLGPEVVVPLNESAAAGEDG
jgi:hypothetical protein